MMNMYVFPKQRAFRNDKCVCFEVKRVTYINHSVKNGHKHVCIE